MEKPNLQKALRKIRNQGTNVLTASAKYNVPRTLHRHLQNGVKEPKKKWGLLQF